MKYNWPMHVQNSVQHPYPSEKHRRELHWHSISVSPNGYHQENKWLSVDEDVEKEGKKSHILLVRMWMDIGTMEVSVEVPPKATNRTFYMTQPYHSWVQTQRTQVNIPQILAHVCFLLHYLQQLKKRTTTMSITKATDNGTGGHCAKWNKPDTERQK